MNMIALLFTVAFANADISTDFNLKSAEQAFNRGSTPFQTALVGIWVRVGAVDSDGTFGKQGEYAADGWFSYDKNPGAYRTELEFRIDGVNPFGDPQFKSVLHYFDRDKGKTGVSKEEQLWNDRVVSTTLATKNPKKESVCGTREECHLLSNGLLLCQYRASGNSDCDRVKYRYYTGYARR